ncbi:alpha/beta fold hydrolase [Rubrivivax rivuli]|nr:alpha/beta fold hydrolase [Rubrivivax rivuli]
MTALTEAAAPQAASSPLPAPQTLPIGGSTVRYRDSGGPGLPVLLTHGIGGSLELWNRQFERADPALRLIAWDMPSHGLSSPAPEDTSLDGIARQGWQLLQALGVGRALLVGNSLGGAVSLRMAAQAPEAACGLLLAAAATLGRGTVLPFRLMTLPGLGELMVKPGPMAVKQQVQAIVKQPGSITPEVLAAIERNVMRPGGSAHFLALLRSLTAFRGQKQEVVQRSHEILRQLRVPFTFLHGEEDAVLPVSHSRQAHQQLPHAGLVVLPGCGHTPQLEQPAAFQFALLDLARQAGA